MRPLARQHAGGKLGVAILNLVDEPRLAFANELHAQRHDLEDVRLRIPDLALRNRDVRVQRDLRPARRLRRPAARQDDAARDSTA